MFVVLPVLAGCATRGEDSGTGAVDAYHPDVVYAGQLLDNALAAGPGWTVHEPLVGEQPISLVLMLDHSRQALAEGDSDRAGLIARRVQVYATLALQQAQALPQESPETAGMTW